MTNPYRVDVSLSTEFLSIPSLAHVITDSHFAERDRMGRLITFLARLNKETTTPHMMGIGIDEATALTLGPQGAGQVYGQGAVYIITADTQAQTCEADAPLSYEALQIKRYVAGDEIGSLTEIRPQNSYEIDVVAGALTPSNPY